MYLPHRPDCFICAIGLSGPELRHSARVSEQRSPQPRRRVPKRLAIVVSLALLALASLAAALGPGHRLVAATLGRPSVVRVQVTLGDPTPSPINLQPGQVLALYLRSPTKVGGFWSPSMAPREEVLVPGVDYPPPLPSSPGFRERYDAYTAQSSGETSLRLQYDATDPATVPASAPKDKYGVPSITLPVKVEGPGLERPSNLGISCSGRSCSGRWRVQGRR